MTRIIRFIKHLPIVLASLALGLGVFVYANKNSNVTTSEATDYYGSITSGMTGTTLKTNLKSIIENHHDISKNYSYAWDKFQAADEDPNNSSNILTIYSRKSMLKTAKDPGQEGDYWNREHTFPNSKISGDADYDNHIIYASEKKVNNARGTIKMGVVTSGTYVKDNNGQNTQCQIGNNLFDPHNVARGIVARTTMYAATLYDLDPTDNFESIATMLRWHLEYLPDSNEQRRNDVVYSTQENRNPFVDHPEYACKIWGNTNSTTQSICGSSGSVSISETSKSIEEGNSFSLSATSSNNSTISWSSSNTAVATVSSETANSGAAITISALAAGSATITASVTISNNTYTATCNLTVTSSGGQGGGSDTYSMLTSISSIDQNAKYVLGIDGTGFHYSGTSSWGLTALPSTQTPLYYTLTKAQNNSSFTAKTTIGNTEYYLQVPTSNTFGMATSAGTSTDLIIGTTQIQETNYAVANKNTTDRHLRINGANGLRSYAGTTGTMAYFYKVEESSSSSPTLSSISVSGQKTSFTVGDSFSFGGTVTATFSDSTTSNVTSAASFSGYNMNSVGNQTVTVSYTYSGTTKTTTYSIVVSSVSYRTVMEEGYSTIGTINYTNDVEEISVDTLSTAESGDYSQIDTQYHAWRLGAGSKTGTLTVNSTSTNIRKIVVNAKYYGSDSGTTFTIGGTSNTLTNSYADYTKEYGTATNSVAISSVTNGKRVLIATITVYSYSSQNIGNTEDCIGLESFINNYMHMDYTQNLGYCKDNTHHYYSSAKAAFNALNTHQRSLFVSNSAYATEWARLSAWATANGETINASNQLVQGNNLSISPVIPEKNATIIMIVIVSLIGLSSIGACLYIRRRRAQ